MCNPVSVESSEGLKRTALPAIRAGTIEFTGTGATVEIPLNTTVTFGPGVTVRGRTGTISGGGTLINQGKFSADTAGDHLQIQPAIWTHNGMAEVLNGAELTLGGAWNGTGPVAVQNGTLRLAGQFGPLTTPITKTADGVVRITGVGNLQNSTLTLNAATGSWIIEGGTLRNGTLNLTEGATLRPTRNGSSLLQQMTVNGDIVMTPGPVSSGPETYLTVRGGLTLNGTLAMGSYSVLLFDETQTLSAGTIEFTAALATSGATVDIGLNSTVTFGPGMRVRGSIGTLSGFGTLINQGKISADVAGGTLRITVTTFTNEGTLEAINGGTLVAPGFP